VELGRRGRKRRLTVEDEYWKLILEGVGTVEACRESGLGARPAIGGEPNAVACRRCASARLITGRYLSQLERQRIATLRAAGWVCARSLGDWGERRRR
jgi:hypothetical protein